MLLTFSTIVFAISVQAHNFAGNEPIAPEMTCRPPEAMLAEGRLPDALPDLLPDPLLEDDDLIWFDPDAVTVPDEPMDQVAEQDQAEPEPADEFLEDQLEQFEAMPEDDAVDDQAAAPDKTVRGLYAALSKALRHFALNVPELLMKVPFALPLDLP